MCQNSIKDSYHLALGRFVDQFAHCENIIFVSLIVVAKIGKDEGVALLNGAKTDQCLSFFKRLHAAREDKIPPEISEAMEQLYKVNKFRNDLLHRGASFGESITSTNATKAMPGKEDIRTVTVKDLENAHADLVKIITVFVTMYFADKSAPELQIKTSGVLHKPWLYKQ